MAPRGLVLATTSAGGSFCPAVTASLNPSMVGEMFRRIELGSALAATLLGLIWLGYEAHSIQLLYASGAGFGSGAGPGPSLSLGTVMLYFAGAALLYVCVSMSAYLHVVRGHQVGLAALWILAVLAVIGLAIEMFMSGLFLPPTIQIFYLEQQAGLLWLEALAVAATMLTVIAAAAGAPPRLTLELPRVVATDPDGSPTA